MTEKKNKLSLSDLWYQELQHLSTIGKRWGLRVEWIVEKNMAEIFSKFEENYNHWVQKVQGNTAES